MLSKDHIQRLDRLFPVLTKLSAKDRDMLFSAGQVIELPDEQMLMQQSHQCQFVPFVLNGVLRIYKLSPNGREMTLYRTTSGETCLASIACQLTGEEFPAMAQVEEAAELFMVPSQAYHEILDKQLAWKDFLINSMYTHLIETMQTLEAVAFDRTDNRLVHWLLEQTHHKPGTIRYTHEAIAVELGTAREVVSRLLGELKSEGAVRLGRGRIEVINPGLLRQMIE